MEGRRHGPALEDSEGAFTVGVYSGLPRARLNAPKVFGSRITLLADFAAAPILTVIYWACPLRSCESSFSGSETYEPPMTV